MDHFKHQKKLPNPNLGIQVGVIRSLSSPSSTALPQPLRSKNTSRALVATKLSLYNDHNEFLPTDYLQKLLTNHHFNQQLTMSFPIPSIIYHNDAQTHPVFSQIESTIYEALQQTYTYHLQCELSLLFTEPFASRYFQHLVPTDKNTTNTTSDPSTNKPPRLPCSQLYATSTHTTLHHNSFSIVNDAVCFNLTKDTYQSLGFTAPYTLKHGMYQFKIPIDRPNLPRLQELLSKTHINTVSMVIFAQQGNVSIPIDFSLLDHAAARQQLAQASHPLAGYGTMAFPTRTQPVLQDSPLSPRQPTTSQEDLATISHSAPIQSPHDITTLATISKRILWKRLNFRYLSTPPQLNGQSPSPLQYTIIPALHDQCNLVIPKTTPTDRPSTPSSPDRIAFPQVSSSLTSQRYIQSTITNSSPTPNPPLTWISSYFRYLPLSTLHNYISSFLTTKTDGTTLESQCTDNLLHENQISHLKQKRSNKVKSINKPVSLFPNAKHTQNPASESDSDQDSEDSQFMDPKYINSYIQKVRESTKTPPKAPKTELYQQIAHQILFYIGLIYTNNEKLYSFMKKRNKSSAGPKYDVESDPFSKLGFDNPSVSVKSSFQVLNVEDNSVDQTSLSITSGQICNITIRGILPPCVLTHIFKHLRHFLNSQLQFFPTSIPPTPSTSPNLSKQVLAVPYFMMSVYGIPSAVVQFGDKFHHNSLSFGGNGESNYTIILTSLPDQLNSNSPLCVAIEGSNAQNKDDVAMGDDDGAKTQHQQPTRISNDAFIVFRSVDHGSQEL